MDKDELRKKLEPFAEMLYETHTGLIKQRKKLEKKIMKDFGAVEVYVSVSGDGVRMLISLTSAEPLHFKFRYDAG